MFIAFALSNGNNSTMGPAFPLAQNFHFFLMFSLSRAQIKEKFPPCCLKHLRAREREKVSLSSRRREKQSALDSTRRRRKKNHLRIFWSAFRLATRERSAKRGCGTGWRKEFCFIDSCKMKREQDAEKEANYVYCSAQPLSRSEKKGSASFISRFLSAGSFSA